MLNDNQENDMKLLANSGKADKLLKQADSFDIPNNLYVGTFYEDVMVAMMYGEFSVLKSDALIAEKLKKAPGNLSNSNINNNSIDGNVELSCMTENYEITDDASSYYKRTRSRR